MEQGYVVIHRQFLKWEWATNSNMVNLFVHLLLMANHQDNKWQGIDIKRGQLITGLDKLSKITGISAQTLRTCLTRLKSTGEITSISTNKFRIITILKYDYYQSEHKKSTSKLTSKLTINQQTTNKQLTTTKELKERKNNIPAKAGVKSMKNYKEKTIDYETGNTVEEPLKTNKSKEAIKLAQLFDKMASEYSKKPIITPKSYFIVINAINKHGLKTKGIIKLYQDWFNNEKVKKEDKVNLSFALSSGNINAFKALN